MPTRLPPRLLAAGLATAALAATAHAAPRPVQSVPAGAAALASLTGTASPYGTGQLRGTRLAARDLGSAGAGLLRVRVIARDDGSDPATAARRMRALVRDPRVSAVLGPTLSSSAAAADPVAAAAGVPVLAVTNTTLDLARAGRTVWRVALSEDRLIPASVGYAARDLGVRGAVLVSVTGDAYSEGAAASFRAAAAGAGIALAADLTAPTGTADLRPLLRRAQAAGAGALLLAARSDDAVRLLVQAAEVGIAGPRVGGNGFNAPEVVAAAGAAAEGLVVSASWSPGRADAASRGFARRYRAAYGTTPDAFAAQGYAGVEVLAAAVRAGGGTRPAQVLAGLRAIRSVPTVLGRVRFSGREAVYAPAVQRVQGGRLVLVG